LERYEYQRYQVGTLPYWTPLRFPGQYHDAETDLFENWNRYYDPSVGRYLQPEPLAVNPSSFSSNAEVGLGLPVYAYTYNNSLNYVDPTGLQGTAAACRRHPWLCAGFESEEAWRRALEAARVAQALEECAKAEQEADAEPYEVGLVCGRLGILCAANWVLDEARRKEQECRLAGSPKICEILAIEVWIWRGLLLMLFSI
jgi:RHS repeat-associated protein